MGAKRAVVILLCCSVLPALAQKRSIPPRDTSRTVHGKVLFRNADGSVRPAPFIEVHVWSNSGWWESENKKAAEDERNRDNDAAKAGLSVSIGCAQARAREQVNVGIMRKGFLRAFQTDENGNFSGNLPGDLSNGETLVFVAALNTDSSPLFVWEDILILRKGEASKIILVDPNHCDN